MNIKGTIIIRHSKKKKEFFSKIHRKYFFEKLKKFFFFKILHICFEIKTVYNLKIY